MTQCEKVMDYIKTNGSINAFEAFRNLHITRLSARIYDLRKMGIKIKQERRYKNETHYDVFSLVEE